MMLGMASCAMVLTGCDDDIDEWKVSELSSPSIELAASDNVVITMDNMTKVVLNINYEVDGHEIYITNNESAGTALGDGAYSLEAAATNSFAVYQTKTLSPETGINTISLTGEDVNIMAMALGLKEGESNKMYFRIAHSYLSDDTRHYAYSDVIEANVTPILIELNEAYVLDKEQSAVVDTLYSPAMDGIYKGFLATTGGWFNFWVKDKMNVVWGNLNSDEGFGKISSSSDAWNFWTGEALGCIYVNMNTNTGEIVYTNFSEIAIGGENTSGSLSFNATNNEWTGVVTTEADNATLTLTVAELINNSATEDAKEKAISATETLGFDAEGVLTIGSTTALTIAKASSYKLTIGMGGQEMTYSLDDLGSMDLYPSKVVAKAGDKDVELTTETASGLATGIYTGSIENTAAANTLTFVDGDGNTLDVTATLANEGKTYTIRLDLTTNTVEIYEMTETMILSLNSDFSTTDVVFYASGDKYIGLFHATVWKFFLKDSNEVLLGCNSSWKEGSMEVGSANNQWVDPGESGKTYYMVFDMTTMMWSATKVTDLELVGGFNSWALTSTFTDNGDGTWTLSGTELQNEEWGPYILVNGAGDNWNNKLYLASDGTTLKGDFGSMVMPTEGAGTYDITIDAKSNTISFTAKSEAE